MTACFNVLIHLGLGVTEMGNSRPYRSHRFPACAFCRQRRVRCAVEEQGQPCRLCQKADIECSIARKQKATEAVRKSDIARQNGSMQPMEGTSHILGPVVARNTHDVQQYLYEVEGQLGNDMRYPSLEGVRRSQPVYHIPIPRPRPSPARGGRNLPKELLNQARPHLHVLVAAFYDRLHPCYPITDENFVISRMRESYLPEGFFVGMLTYAAFYWDTLLELPAETKPDHFSACQAAFSLNTADIQKTDLWTILALCYNLAGRPSKCLVGNVTNVARIVGLSHAIGLNHDCKHWDISEIEKRIRWKAWWAVLIQDRWFHFAHGTPPHIAREQYDVPVPTQQLLLCDRLPSLERARAAEVYIAFCRLTEIVGSLLPLIYRVRSGANDVALQKTARLEAYLQEWIKDCPTWIDFQNLPERPAIPGFANLQLSYLAVRMVICQISWHQSRECTLANSTSLLLNCKIAAEDIVTFVESLHPYELSGFWLPHIARHFTSTTTLLLSCGAQVATEEIAAQCLTSARTLVNCLRRYKIQYEWDLAGSVLAQNEDLLNMADEILRCRSVARASQTASTTIINASSSTNEQAEPDDSLNAYNDPMLAEFLPELFPEISDQVRFSTFGNLGSNAAYD